MMRTALEAKGVELGKPATDQSLMRLERELQLTLHHELRNLYLQFDGFSSYDHKSQMMLWPLERIVEEKALAHEASGVRFFAIGDFLIDTDFLISPLSSEGPVVLLYEQRRLAPSVTAFLEKLTSGKFDFLERTSQG